MAAASGISRRHFLKTVGVAAGACVAAQSGLTRPARARAQEPKRATHHLAWAWQFDVDGDPEEVRATLAENGMGIILKTHEGANWMSRYDDSRHAVNGPDQVRGLATYFEVRNVPFHAWCIVEGHDPIAEARMCSDVLNSGARSLTLDLEPREGPNYWHAGPEEALAFGQELRRLQPKAWISVAPDPRPWQLAEVPLAEFAQISNEIAPQLYWRTFDSPANHRLMDEHGFPVGPDGLTPEGILDMSQASLAQFDRPIRPVGQGAAGLEDWDRFVRHAYSLGMPGVSVWRYGTSEDGLWPLLRDLRHPDDRPLESPTQASRWSWLNLLGWRR